MKYDCDVIRDLLPLYDDKVASEKSMAVVEEHLKKCPACQEYHKRAHGTVEIDQKEETPPNGEPDYAAVAKKVRKKRKTVFSITAIVMVLAVTVIVWIGARIPINGDSFFTSAGAVESIQLVEDSSDYLIKETVGPYPYEVYVYEYEDSYQTVVTRYQFPLWKVVSRSLANRYPDDPVELLGRVSMTMDDDDGFTFIAVRNNDPAVSYIEIGSGDNRIRKEAPVGEVLAFVWEPRYPWNNDNAVAYTEDGTPLYQLTYDMVGNTIQIDCYHWKLMEES